MNFNEIYNKHHKIIHYLLKKYHVSYNYDEFYQLLLIKLWQLSTSYQASHNCNINTFLFTRLKFYLFDLFRQQHRINEVISFDTNLITGESYTSNLNDFSLYYNEMLQILTTREQQWLSLHLAGYKQYEIANIMNLSISTIKTTKANIKIKLSHYKN
ncbi:sigma-70 family RNA polymerase sigma factor [Staphylococcus simiae]|uniref:sigma-70 family RNA polymerase sigma factor n=1 Tax=Staphylococcus simiae TaxID=308354 RepID=UPI001A95704C|nr:sigma-70 family RNA polymerase sigma factor [Staphylococcus simiae]MBO1199951.1 sigma-70 family RNA polymerase sigma factor [Staphylococcus simiae]MBO1202213.1 sigma-70 family RNA polymerase sigma factor [Staphylococcus simiae]MBO1204478.1 sigma-70 family RNA polymerase sigma factor [Staphylococcus simiae]MBO1212030.1 sigma-70 family RNA polymerase sigma factor [Staphylococcus simiae]MBO1230656.1 sigma-70 family RNA polymerase sigma factor [Staphylococcus simiae]